MQTNRERLVIPITMVAGLLLVLMLTNTWVRRSVEPTHVRVTMGPPLGIVVPERTYGLRFTPRNRLSGRVLHDLVPAQRGCVDVTVSDSSLTYLDQRRACRLRDGSYKMPYAFPEYAHYLVYVDMQVADGVTETARIPVPLGRCELARTVPCHPALADLRGLETVRSHIVDATGLTAVLTAPAHAVLSGRPVQIALVYLRHGHVAPDVEPARLDAVAISLDTFHFVRLRPDPGQATSGRLTEGTVSFSGLFDTPAIYRVFVTVRHNQKPLRTSFVIDVNPAPPPTPDAG